MQIWWNRIDASNARRLSSASLSVGAARRVFPSGTVAATGALALTAN